MMSLRSEGGWRSQNYSPRKLIWALIWEPKSHVFFLVQAYDMEGSLVVGKEWACYRSRGVCLGKKVDKALFLISCARKLLVYCIGMVGRSSFNSVSTKKNRKTPQV